MTELLAILIPPTIVIGGALMIAKLAKIDLFTKEDGYTSGWIEGFIIGASDDDNDF